LAAAFYTQLYELYVPVQPAQPGSGYLPAPGFVIDVKELKAAVKSAW
jgi:hypothetical protein